MLIYDGPSMLNGKPILGILILKSTNRKTGNMVQLHILPKRVNPVKASKTGYDKAVCGDCPLRHSKGGGCYVNVGHGPAAVYKAYRNGKYPSNVELAPQRSFRRMRIRLGAYGDPTALPYKVVSKLVNMFDGHTGYTHQWQTCDQKFSKLIMASTESSSGRTKANGKGWRTFRVVSDYDELGANERVCANESHGVSCDDCMACHGKGGRMDIAIKVHGSWGKRLKLGPMEKEIAAG